jgi:FkbM family methyltransferase
MRQIESLLRRTHTYGLALHGYRSLFRREKLRSLARSKAFYRAFVPRGSLAFDIGANQGSRSEIFLELGARVVAAEPLPELAKALRDWKRFDRNLTVVQKAVGAVAGSATLHIANYSVISTLTPEWVALCKQQPHMRDAIWSTEKVEVTTLDALIDQFGVPAFTKIDVEGYEVEVLQGLSRPIPALSFEYTPFRHEPALECLRLLRRFGRARFNSSPADSFVMRHEKWLDEAGVVEFCAHQVPREAQYGDIYVVFDG